MHKKNCFPLVTVTSHSLRASYKLSVLMRKLGHMATISAILIDGTCHLSICLVLDLKTTFPISLAAQNVLYESGKKLNKNNF